MCVSSICRVLDIPSGDSVALEDLTHKQHKGLLLAIGNIPLLPGDYVVVHTGYVTDVLSADDALAYSQLVADIENSTS